MKTENELIKRLNEKTANKMVFKKGTKVEIPVNNKMKKDKDFLDEFGFFNLVQKENNEESSKCHFTTKLNENNDMILNTTKPDCTNECCNKSNCHCDEGNCQCTKDEGNCYCTNDEYYLEFEHDFGERKPVQEFHLKHNELTFRIDAKNTMKTWEKINELPYYEKNNLKVYHEIGKIEIVSQKDKNNRILWCKDAIIDEIEWHQYAYCQAFLEITVKKIR